MLYNAPRNDHNPTACTARRTRVRAAPRTRRSAVQVDDAEATVLEALQGVKGRGKEGLAPEQLRSLEDAVRQLEDAGGVSDPTTRSDLLDGRWKLLYTSRPGSASPIQRAFTGTESFKIFQEIRLAPGADCRVNNIVEFGSDASIGVLRVEAEANTESRPLPGFTPRRGAGLPLFGKSETGPPARDHIRIDFQFDKAAFDFRSLPFKIPYPVPFKLLGDETKGWIDITYLNGSGTFRLTRGNKGTLFVLTRSETLVDELLVAVRDGDDTRVLACVDRLAGRGVPSPAESRLVLGTWRQVWSQQADDANVLQKALSPQARNWQVITEEEGQAKLENRVQLGPLRVRALASCSTLSSTRTHVDIDAIRFELLGGAIERKRDAPGDAEGYVDWLYLDEGVRVTRGNKGSLFIHVRE